MRHIRILTVTFMSALGLALPVSARAQGGSPLRTQSPSTAPKGGYVWKIAVTMDDAGTRHVWRTPQIDVAYGILDNLQVQAKLPWVVVGQGGESTSGIGNANLSFKWRFAEHAESKSSIAFYPQWDANVSAKSRDKGLVSRGWQLILPFEAATRVGRVRLGTEVGYRIASEGRESWVYGVAAGYPVHARVDLVGEYQDVISRRWRVRDPVLGLGTRITAIDGFRVLLAGERHVGGVHARGRGAILYIGVEITR